MRIARPLFFLIALPLLVASPFPSQVTVTAAQHGAQAVASSPTLVEKVRHATEPFRDAENVPEGYGAALGCVSGPDRGAMGAHFVNAGLIGDDVLDATRPEALIYEIREGRGRLVGAEFIVTADAWHATHALNDPPILEGQLLHFVESPNRFGLPAFYELHVWAWRENPNGAFVDWNTNVTCEAQ